MTYVNVDFDHEFPELWKDFIRSTGGVLGRFVFIEYLRSKHNIRACIDQVAPLGTVMIPEDRYLWLKLKYN